MTARFDDALDGTALVFPQPVRVLTARRAADVAPLLDEVDRATRDGAWAFGFLAYEAAAGLDPGCAVAAPGTTEPLAWFGISPAPAVEALVARCASREYWCSRWQLDATAEQHRRGVRHAQHEIAAGNIYQANLTSRTRATVRGELAGLYADLVHAQQASFNAFLDLGDATVLSASPELLFEWSPPMLRCRPMKGTARRGMTRADDDAAASRLSASTKDIAENVMIVDLVRNDLGRIARTGSVRVTRLCVGEPFGSVWQLSSDVEAEPRADVGLGDVFSALFPSGSITGAPKRAAMSVIRELEPDPRGAYCGAIGWVAPPGHPTRARFNVAIRTVVVDRRTGTAVYGAGGGITAASDPDSEFQELLDKTAVLSTTQDDDEL
ncbi:MAG: aminodeoxychorismate synthase component I, partial [Jatrophihabitantaceae bacterium]